MTTWVYLLQSLRFPDKRYVGLTTNLARRIQDHNGGTEHGYAAKFAPWKLVVALRFEDPARAAAFERYLKSGSGHEFSRRHFW